jgi:hypothetical protein
MPYPQQEIQQKETDLLEIEQLLSQHKSALGDIEARLASPEMTPNYAAILRESLQEIALKTTQIAHLLATSIDFDRVDDTTVARTPLQAVWKFLAGHSRFRNVADISVGIHYKPDISHECISDGQKVDFLPGITNPHKSLEPYITTSFNYLCIKPEVMMYNNVNEMAWSKLAWEKPKVIINKAKISQGYWHFCGAIDERGLYATNQFFGVWPKNNIPIEVLASVINGPIANAYLFKYLSQRDNYIDGVENIPIPEFTTEQTDIIVSLVQEYYSKRSQWIACPDLEEHFKDQCLQLIYQIDAVVLEAYALPAELERQLLNQFDDSERRPLPFDFPGYGEEYERAKESLQREKGHRAVLKKYHALVDKKHLDGLEPQEKEEMERLGQEIDKYNAPFYEPILKALSA